MTANKDKKKDWKTIAARKQQDRQARLPVKWLVQGQDLPSKDVLDVFQLIVERKWLNEEELAITGLSVVDLAAAIKKREYTALAVVEAFAHRATIAQQLVNPYVHCVFLGQHADKSSVSPRSTLKKLSRKLEDWMITCKRLEKWWDRCMESLSLQR